MMEPGGCPWLYQNKDQRSIPGSRQMIRILTFEMKEHIRPIVLEHLSNKFDVHVLDVDLLV